MEDLGNFGFSLGEIWDLELVLQDMEMEGATKSDESRSHSKTIPVISPSVSLLLQFSNQNFWSVVK